MSLHMSEEPVTFPAEYWPPRRACTSDACCQGRRECPTPQACVVPEPADKLLTGYRRGIVSALLVVACVVVAMVLRRVFA